MHGQPIEDTFHAWLNTMPGGPHTLHVIGAVEFPSSGYKARLARAEPQGVNPAILILKVEASGPQQPDLQVITRLPVLYEEQPGDGYTEVTILSDAPGFNLPVEIVS